MTTDQQYDKAIAACRKIFLQKTKDYGTSWRVYRTISVADQLYIKAKRIRTIQEKGFSKVNEGEVPEFMGIINYCVMALVQIKLAENKNLVLTTTELTAMYDVEMGEVMELLFSKNHDYAEAWRDMRVSSMTDIILMKLFRIKQIEDNEGQTIVSEGVQSGYQDIINYAVFCLIKLGNEKANPNL